MSRGLGDVYKRQTIGIVGDPAGLEQIIKQVNKLIDVIHCFEHNSDNAVVRELLMIKIQCSPAERSQALQIAEHFSGRTVDLTPTSMIVMITGETSKADAAITMFSQFTIIETVRTGKVVMARGEQPT